MDTKQPKKTLKETVESLRATPPVPQETQHPERKSIITLAHQVHKQEMMENQAIVAKLTTIAESTETEVEVLSEAVTSLLANIATKAEQGKPIDLMHINSVAAFLAGVEAIADALPSSTDEQKKQNTIRVLTTAALEDGTPNSATYPIINLGARKAERHKSYLAALQHYATGQTKGDPQGEMLARLIRMLQMKIDRAMRSSAPMKPMAKTGPSTPGTPPKA